MRAWRFLAENQPIQLTEVPDPVAGPGEVVLAVKAAGLCHTDYAYADGTLTHALAKIPITLGHEFAGVIIQVGGGVTGIEIGQRVGVPTAEGGPGQTTDGGFADQVKVAARWVLPLPDGVAWTQAAPATCGGMTAYHALAKGGVTDGTKSGSSAPADWEPSPSKWQRGWVPRSTSPRFGNRSGISPPKTGRMRWPETSPSSPMPTCR